MPASHGSTSSQNAGPTWAPPRAPLPPHRLAMLANALGVSTPLPAMTMSATVLSQPSPHLGSLPSTSSVDLTWRPGTPSTAVPPSQSKYLLHVIPPVHLPHESGLSDSTELAPSPAASGYHTQFRRGTLVALQSTLQAQLVVIAREYALPSTIGIILYLVTSSPQSKANSPMPYFSPDHGIADSSEPGPRLSEEIWKHIWTRALRAEREESLSQNGIPSPFGLGLTVESNGPSQPLRPLITPTRTEPTQTRPFAYPVTPSTSTSSSVSDLRSHEKSTGESSLRSEPNTPDTSRSSDNGPPGIELPGLSSNSIIPILAKVEFDIDRRKATWYEPWVRNRRMKRSESRSSRPTGSPSRSRDEGDSDEKRLPFDLKLVERMKKPPFLRSHGDFEDGEQPADGEYLLLSDSPDGDEDPAACMTSGHDPLRDVFGTDAETWAGIHSQSEGKRRKVNNPNVVELALDATSLTHLPEQNREDDETDDMDEVRDVMRRMSRPPLNVSIPETDSKQKSTPSTASAKRPMPAPLVLTPKVPTNNLIAAVDDDFRGKEGLSLEMEQEYLRSRSPGEEKRVGTVFEDLDLGLDLGDDDDEYDENDPNDRRRSQYLMKAKLDELERTLAQFSPQQLKTATLDEDMTTTYRRDTSLPPPDFGRGPPGNTPGSKPWPATPYASVTKSVGASSSRPSNLPPSPPRLAVNGVTTGAPAAFMPPVPQLQPPSAMTTESQARRRDFEQPTYASDSPIPLDPDPFGRYPSVYEADKPPVPSYWDPATQKITHEHLDPRPSVSSIDDGSNPSSRFSADSSSVVVDPNDKASKTTAPLVSVRSLKKLWRRSKPTASAPTQPPTPATATFKASSSPPPPPTPTEQLPSPFPNSRNMNGKSHVGQLQFDQESPYPLHPRPSLSASRPTSPAVLTNAPPQEKTGVRKSILKSWKSTSGAGSQQQSNGSDPRQPLERPLANETVKPTRPGVLDGNIPPSPQLPEQYAPSNHARTGSSFFDRRKPTPPSNAGPGQYHSSSSQETPSPSQSEFSAASRESNDQFEIISSPKVPPNYPYMTVDHE